MWHSFTKLHTRGFTLTEMIVSLGIITVLITVILTNQNRYLDGAALTGLADDIALSVSQAQAYGIGVREFAPGTEEFDAGYGLTFSLLSGGSNSAVLFFADRNSNNAYDGTWECEMGGANECLELKNFSRGNYIYEICALRTSGADMCSNIGRVDISFVRPETEAVLTFYNTGGTLYVPPNLKAAKITLRSPTGLSRSITVYLSGQISTQ